MNIRRFICLIVAVVSVCLVIVSCSSHEDEIIDEATMDKNDSEDLSKVQIVRLRLDVGMDDFDKDNKSSTRSISYDWEDGSKLYLIFSSGTKTVSGTATYSKADDWVLTFNGALTRDENTKVKVFYFTKINRSDSDSLYFDATCGVFKDEDGEYFYPTGASEIRIKATLRPVTGRVKFKDARSDYNMDGITYYTSFNFSSGVLSTSKEPLFELDSNEYVYGFFEEGVNRIIRVNHDNYLFTAECSVNFLQKGKSGFLNMPTHEKHNGWDEKLTGGVLKLKDINGDSVHIYWIDLGLPSGLKWADEDFYFEDLSTAHEDYETDDYTDCERLPWGATWFSDKGKTDNYSTSSSDISGTTKDPIWFLYNKKCRLPKCSEFQELVDNLTWKSGFYYNKNTNEFVFGGIIGYNRSNLTCIDLWANGYDKWDFTNWTAENYEYDECGYYWTSTPSSSSKAYCFKFLEDTPIPQKNIAGKALGMLMRPVIDK